MVEPDQQHRSGVNKEAGWKLDEAIHAWKPTGNRRAQIFALFQHGSEGHILSEVGVG